MKKQEQLERAVRNGLKILGEDPSVQEGLVFASANERDIGRLVYTSHIPCNGVQELKSGADFGISVHVRFTDGTVGFGQEANDLSGKAIRAALEKARASAISDPDFHGFPSPEKITGSPVPQSRYDAESMELTPAKRADLLARLSWETLQGAFHAFETYLAQKDITPEDAGFIVSGDQFLIRERMALGTTTGLFEHDQSAIALSFLTAMVEGEESKGSSWGALPMVADVRPFDIGFEAAQNAMQGVGHERVPSGRYTVVFGPQAVVDLFELLKTSLHIGVVEAGGGIFVEPRHFPELEHPVPQSRFGQQVASELLTVYDDASIPGFAGTKRVTCEGYPTGRVELIRDGCLAGFLTDHYMTHKILNRADSLRTIGMTLEQAAELLVPRSGFRFSRGGGRVAASVPSPEATNVFIESREKLSDEELLARAGEGLYIGRLWYTYPVGGYSTGDISGTAIADSYRIRNGKLAEPITPNSLRLNENLKKMLRNIIGIAQEQRGTICWASDQIVYAPWIAVKDVNFTEIGK